MRAGLSRRQMILSCGKGGEVAPRIRIQRHALALISIVFMITIIILKCNWNKLTNKCRKQTNKQINKYNKQSIKQTNVLSDEHDLGQIFCWIGGEMIGYKLIISSVFICFYLLYLFLSVWYWQLDRGLFFRFNCF